MHPHDLRSFQYVERSYRVVTVDPDGERTIRSRHVSFLQAERARKMIPSEEGVEIRIETTAVPAQVARLVG